MSQSTSRHFGNEMHRVNQRTARRARSLVALLVAPLALSIIASSSGCGGASGKGTNSEPTIFGEAENTARAGEEFSFMPGTRGGDNLRFEIVNLPDWASFDLQTGELYGTPVSANLGDYFDIIISVSDGTTTAELPAFSIAVLPQLLNRDNFNTEGDVFLTDTGYESVGNLVISTAGRSQVFKDSDLLLEFDDDGRLIDISGETLLPENPTDQITIDSPVRAVVGMMTGAEINADEKINILLQEDGNYFVFLIDVAIDITIEDRGNPGVFESITLKTPFGGQILLITDPSDPFLYRFGSQAFIGEYGSGFSENALIPYQPVLEAPELEPFNGHEIQQGSLGLGVKIFDFFKISGSWITRFVQFGDIDWEDPFNSPVEYKTGINGDADFNFSVLSVGLFSFDLAEVSATLDVGFDRQNIAMQMRIGPDVSWVPGWFPFVPTTETTGDWFIDGSGDYFVELAAGYQSSVPAANLAGVMTLDNGAVTLAGRTGNAGDELEVSIRFADHITLGRIKFPERYAASIKGDVTDSIDRSLADIEQAILDLENAVADYEFEASLRGLRSAIPAIVNSTVATLDKIPNKVGNQAYTQALVEMSKRCITLVGQRICVDDVTDEKAHARYARTQARNNTRTSVNTTIARLNNLKSLASMGDDEALREGLRQALLYAYNNRRYSRNVKVTRKISVDLGLLGTANFGTVTFYNKTHSETVMDTATANKIKQAADNVHRIPATSDIMISAQQIFDALPTDQIMRDVKQSIQDGVASVPVPEGLGYRAIGDRYEAFVTIGGVDHDVEFNVLRPSDVRTGVSDLLTDLLIPDAL